MGKRGNTKYIKIGNDELRGTQIRKTCLTKRTTESATVMKVKKILFLRIQLQLELQLVLIGMPSIDQNVSHKITPKLIKTHRK